MKINFSIAAIIYLILFVMVYPYVKWYADNPDTFQYLEIAKKYLSGDFSHAVNGYWSPMISWLLMIPLFFTNDGLFAFKILQFLIGLFTFWQWYVLLRKTNLSRQFISILTLISIPFLLDYALLNCTPDLLFLGLLFALIRIFIDGNVFSEKGSAIYAGIIASCLFLTKSFGLPFAISVFIVAVILEYRMKSIRWKNFAISLGVLLGICMIWISILSFRYDSFTISKAASFNMSRDVAPLPSRSDELPILGKGLLVPQENSSSAWETPGEYVSKERVSLISSPSDYSQIIRRNFLTIYYFDFRNQIGIIFFVLIIVSLFSKRGREIFTERWVSWFMIFIFLIYGGYSLILVHTRYVWINTFLMLTIITYVLMNLFSGKNGKKISGVVLILIFGLVLKRPFKEILFTADKNYPVNWIFQAAKHPFETMWIDYRPDMELHRVIEDLKSKKMISGNIASLKISEMERDPYTSSLRISLENNCKYFGQLDDKLEFENQLQQLRLNNINFLITWKNNVWGEGEPVYYSGISGVRVYKIS